MEVPARSVLVEYSSLECFTHSRHSVEADLPLDIQGQSRDPRLRSFPAASELDCCDEKEHADNVFDIGGSVSRAGRGALIGPEPWRPREGLNKTLHGLQRRTLHGC